MSDEEKPPLENLVEFRKPDRQEGAPERLPRKRNQPASQGGSGNKFSSTKGQGKHLYFGYRPGESLSCKIVKAEQGGYSVMISRDNMPGYLPSTNKYKAGDEVMTNFVRIDKNRVLVAEMFTNGKTEPARSTKKIESRPLPKVSQKDTDDSFDDVD